MIKFAKRTHKKPHPGKKKGQDYRPVVRDFSQKSIKKALLKNTAGHWSFQYSLVGVIGSVACGALFGINEIIYLAFFSTFGASCFSWIYNYFIKADTFELRYIDNLKRKIEEETEGKRRRLAQELKALNCPRGYKQLTQLQADFDSLVELLGTMLNTHEVTYKRYHGIALEVFLSGIDNLKKILTALMSISEINETDIQNSINKLKNTPGKENEIKVLQERIQIKNQQLKKVDEYLNQNEIAITQLEKTAALITNLDSGLDEGKIDMESSMDDLSRIVDQAKKRMQIIKESKS